MSSSTIQHVVILVVISLLTSSPFTWAAATGLQRSSTADPAQARAAVLAPNEVVAQCSQKNGLCASRPMAGMGYCTNDAYSNSMKNLIKMIADGQFGKSMYEINRNFDKLAKSVRITDDPVTANTKYELPILYRYLQFSAITYCDKISAEYSARTTLLPSDPLRLSSERPYPFHLHTGDFIVDRVFDQSSGDFNTPTRTLMDVRFVVFISIQRRELIVAFRGTNNVHNIVTDARDKELTRLDPTWFSVLQPNGTLPNGGTAYEGFVHATNSQILETIYRRVRSLRADPKYANFDLIVTGHSLGAAQAVLASAALSFRGMKPKWVFAYSIPVLGNTAFEHLLVNQIGKERLIHVVAQDDIVPWGRADATHGHPSSIMEVNISADKTTKTCAGGCFPVKAKDGCAHKNWYDHFVIGDFNLYSFNFCPVYSQSAAPFVQPNNKRK